MADVKEMIDAVSAEKRKIQDEIQGTIRKTGVSLVPSRLRQRLYELTKTTTSLQKDLKDAMFQLDMSERRRVKLGDFIASAPAELQKATNEAMNEYKQRFVDLIEEKSGCNPVEWLRSKLKEAKRMEMALTYEEFEFYACRLYNAPVSDFVDPTERVCARIRGVTTGL
jgi:enoyl reductase-like protein